MVDSCRHSSTHTHLHACTHIHTYTHSKREVYALTVYTVAPAMGSVFIVDALRAFSSLPPPTFPLSLGISILIQANRASHTHTHLYTQKYTSLLGRVCFLCRHCCRCGCCPLAAAGANCTSHTVEQVVSSWTEFKMDKVRTSYILFVYLLRTHWKHANILKKILVRKQYEKKNIWFEC